MKLDKWNGNFSEFRSECPCPSTQYSLGFADDRLLESGAL